MEETNTPEAKPEKDDKKKPRRIGQRQEVAKGKHVIRVFGGRDTVTGKRHYHSETFLGGARQAEDRIREIIRRHRAGDPIKANADTFESFLDERIESKRLSVEESSLKTYREKVDWFLRPTLGPKLLTRVQAGDVQSLYAKLREDGLSRETIHDVHVILNMIFKLAVKRKKLIGSPMAGVEFPKDWIDDEDEDKERAVTPQQVAQFLDAAEGTRVDNLFRLAFHVGCRPGELLALKWADLDTAAKTLRVNQSIVWRKAGDWYLKKPKTKLSCHTLPLTDTLLDLLASQRKR